MGTGYLPDDILGDVLNEVVHIPGDFAEIGVFQGALFKRLVAVAQVLRRKAHAFDSFVGMDEPSPRDFGKYPKGTLSSGGKDHFRRVILDSIERHRNLARSGQQDVGVYVDNIRDDVFELWDGYVPECLHKCPINQFSFIYIDLDHHDPTLQAIEWAWPRLAPGGILGFDDYFPGRDRLASPPIDAFLDQRYAQLRLIHFNNNQLFVRKRDASEVRRNVA